MHDNRRSRTWLHWLTVTIPGVALLIGFVVMGGLGSGQRSVALADTSTTSSTSTSATITTVSSQGVNISTSTCAGPTVSGALELSDALSGEMTLGLFALSQHELPLARRFTDTGQRATATFTGSTTAAFLFSVVPSGSVDYLVVVLPASGSITDASQLVESAVLPLCGTRKATVTTTETTTTTSTATNTSTVILTQTVTQTTHGIVVVPIDPCLGSSRVIGNAKTHRTAHHYSFAAHMRHVAKTTFSTNFKFTGLTKANIRTANGCCFCC